MPPIPYPQETEPPPPLPPRRPSRKLIGRGVAAALALGVVGGFLMRPNLEDEPPAKPAARKVEIPREPDNLQIMVTPRPEPVTPLTPPGQTVTPLPTLPSQPAPRPVDPSNAARPDPAPEPRPARTARPSFNCRFARTQSERMVCVDPRLAAADRRLAQAYRNAVDAGIPERVLRRQQDMWLGAREAAARHGPEEVARVYEARISELQGMSRY